MIFKRIVEMIANVKTFEDYWEVAKLLDTSKDYGLITWKEWELLWMRLVLMMLF